MSKITKLFKTPDAPRIDDPAPLPNEETADRARRRRIASLRSRSGRQSTHLTKRDSAIGTEFTRTLLG